MTSKLQRSVVPRRIAFRCLMIVALGASCAGALLANHSAFAQAGSAPTVQAIPNGKLSKADILAQQNQAALAAQSLLSLQQTPTLPSANTPFSGQNLYSQQVGQEALFGHTSPSMDLNFPLTPP